MLKSKITKSLKYNNLETKSRNILDQSMSQPRQKEELITTNVSYKYILQYKTDNNDVLLTKINRITKHELIQKLLYTNNILKQIKTIYVNSTLDDLTGTHSQYCINDKAPCILLTIDITVLHPPTILSSTIRHYILQYSNTVQNALSLPYIKYIGQNIFSTTVKFDLTFNSIIKDDLNKDDVEFFESKIKDYMNTQWMLNENVISITSVIVLNYTLYNDDIDTNTKQRQFLRYRLLETNIDNTLRFNTELSGEYSSMSKNSIRYKNLITDLFQDNQNVKMLTNVLKSHVAFEGIKSLSVLSMEESIDSVTLQSQDTSSFWTSHMAIILYAVLSLLVYCLLYYVLYVKLYKHRKQKVYDTSDFNDFSTFWGCLRNHSSGKLCGTRFTEQEDDDLTLCNKISSTNYTNTTASNHGMRRVQSDDKLDYKIPESIIKRSASFDLSSLKHYYNNKTDYPTKKPKKQPVACGVIDESARPKKVPSHKKSSKKKDKRKSSTEKQSSRKQHNKVSQNIIDQTGARYTTNKPAAAVTYVSSNTLNEIIKNEKEYHRTGKQTKTASKRSISKIPMEDSSRTITSRQNEELSFVNETFDDDQIAQLNSQAIIKDLQNSLLKISIPKEYKHKM